MTNSSILTIHRTLSVSITPGTSRTGSNGNEEVLPILQTSNITGVSLSDFLVPYPGHFLEESYPSAEMQSVYCTALVDRIPSVCVFLCCLYNWVFI